ncbi:MAG: methylated-DNA--[protein]-cysteine S-methyltransferase [Rhodospirillales bacterium]|nr:methylated-DNA--[protein]-cysteine S-methyltransferase [Rhodospirillales bacterium]
MAEYISFNSPIGPLTVFSEDGALIVIEAGAVPGAGSGDPLLKEARRQIDDYFDGKLKVFDLPTNPAGTPRQREIWNAMAKIPYGETCTYGELAETVKSSARAIGGACGRNPLPIVIPCHRVLGANDAIGGYSFADGAATKRQLLMLEGVRLGLI